MYNGPVRGAYGILRQKEEKVEQTSHIEDRTMLAVMLPVVGRPKVLAGLDDS